MTNRSSLGQAGIANRDCRKIIVPTTGHADCTRADIMQWMLSHQKARRNLTAGESLHANQMIMEEIELENKQKQLEGTFNSHQVRKEVGSVHVDGTKNTSHTSPTHTREQLAKMSGVGTGTVARYQAIMKTDNEELKKKVNTGEVPVGTAYREIKTRVCKVCGKEKKIIDFFGNDILYGVYVGIFRE